VTLNRAGRARRLGVRAWETMWNGDEVVPPLPRREATILFSLNYTDRFGQAGALAERCHNHLTFTEAPPDSDFGSIIESQG